MKRLTPTFMSGPSGNAAQYRARIFFEQVVDRFAVEPDRHAVDQDGVDARRRVGHESLSFGGHVAHAAQRPGRQLLEVDHDDVGRAADAYVATIDADDVGDLTGELAHAALDGHHLPVAHPGRQEVGRHHRVADLADVGPGIGQSHDAAFALHEQRDAGFVVVGERDLEAGHQVVVERDVSEGIERRATPIAGNRCQRSTLELGVRLRIGDGERLPARIDPLAALELVVDAGTPRGIAIQARTLGHRRRDQIGERRELVERRRLVHQDLLHDRPARDLDPHVGTIAPPSLWRSSLPLNGARDFHSGGYVRIDDHVIVRPSDFWKS